MNKEEFAGQIQTLIYKALTSDKITARQMFDVLCEHEETLRGVIYQRDNEITQEQWKQPPQWKSDPPATEWKSGL